MYNVPFYVEPCANNCTMLTSLQQVVVWEAGISTRFVPNPRLRVVSPDAWLPSPAEAVDAQPAA